MTYGCRQHPLSQAKIKSSGNSDNDSDYKTPTKQSPKKLNHRTTLIQCCIVGTHKMVQNNRHYDSNTNVDDVLRIVTCSTTAKQFMPPRET